MSLPSVLVVRQRARRRRGHFAGFTVPLLSWREWSYPKDKRQRQEHKDASTNEGRL
jgi:hypothetical protein